MRNHTANRPWSALLMAALLALSASAPADDESASVVQTPYGEQKILFDFYFDDPHKLDSALYWIRSIFNPLTQAPYDLAPEALDIKVVIHGTEIVTLAKHNYAKYKTAVDRMRYYSEFGVEFKVCGLAAVDYGYRPEDLQGFVEIVPSAIPELAHWQQQGYALIAPKIMEKKFSIEEIR